MTDARLVCACASARTVARTLTQLYDEVLRETGLEAPQFALLMTLDQAGPSSQADLGRRFALDKTTISRNLRWLERQGWVAAAAAADRRERQFALTAEGRKRFAAARPRWREAQRLLRAQMTGAEWNTMFRSFARVIEAGERAKRRR